MPAERFVGQARDAEAGLDYVSARMYLPRIGRLATVDPASGRALRPSLWNRFAYSVANPLRFVDPSGATVVEVGSGYYCPPSASSCVNVPTPGAYNVYGVYANGQQIDTGSGLGSSSEAFKEGYAQAAADAKERQWDDAIGSRNYQYSKYDSDVDAVRTIYAIYNLASADTGWEWGTTMSMYDNGNVRVGTPVTSQLKTRIEGDTLLAVSVAPESTRFGVYHTHPANYGFSPADKGFGKEHGLTIYMSDPSTNIWRITPGGTPEHIRWPNQPY